MVRKKYNPVDVAWAIRTIKQLSVALDNIPYTKTFDKLFEDFNHDHLTKWTRPDLWQLMLNARKKGVGRKSRLPVSSPDLTLKQNARLGELLPTKRGEIDRLPYTAEFESIYTTFNRYLDRHVSKHEVWLACLRLAKSKMRPKAKPFVSKAIRRLRHSINAFNTMGNENRLDDVLIGAHHAIEMLLKAALIQQQIPEIDSASGHYRSFKECLKDAIHHEDGRFLSQADGNVIRALDAQRGDAYHGLIELDETELFLVVNTIVDIFSKVLRELFGIALVDSMETRVMPISTLPFTNVHFLFSRKEEQIRNLLNSGEKERALASTRSLKILDKAIQGKSEARVTLDEVRKSLTQIANGDEIARVFPSVNAITISQSDSGAIIRLSVSGKKHLPVRGESQAASGTVVAIKKLDPKNTHPHQTKDLVERTGISRNKLLGIIAELDLKNDDTCCYKHRTPKGQPTFGYSEKAVIKIRDFAETFDGDLKSLYSKHFMNRK